MFLHEFVHLAAFTKTCYVPGTVLDAWDRLISKTNKNHCGHRPFIYEDGQVISINNKHILVITKIKCMDYKKISTIERIEQGKGNQEWVVGVG